jgi:two-component system, cell cycle response regulator DivK
MQQDPRTVLQSDIDSPAILVVDDDEDSRRILMYGLGNAGYRVFFAENGAAAVELCRVVLPSVVIMDLAMPEMDGFAATRALKADERTRDVPVIAWSARVLVGDAPELFSAGFDEVLPKPSLPSDIIEAVRRLIPSDPAPRAD